MPFLDEVVTEGMITLEEVEIIRYTPKQIGEKLV